MSKKPLISIVIPVYNTEKYLKRCLDSIVNQTYSNIEIIIVNDGSTDRSLKIAEEFKKKDSRILIINQENSGGVIARKNGVNKARGEYVLTEDSDDWVERDMVEKCVKALRGNNADIVKFGYYDEELGKEINILNQNIFTSTLLKNNEINQVLNRLIYNTECNTIWNQLVKRELYNFDDKIFKKIVHKGEDRQINLQLFQAAKRVIFIKDILYHYAYNPESISNNINVMKIARSISDDIYLNRIGSEIANKTFGSVDKIKLYNKTLSYISSKIIRVLARSENAKQDLQKIHDASYNDIRDYFSGFNKNDIKMNFIKKSICINILNNKPDKNIMFLPICKILKWTGRIK